MQRPIGQRLDDPDELFNWLHEVIIGIPAMHFAVRSGLSQRLLESSGTLAELARDLALPFDKLERVIAYLEAHELLATDAEGQVHATFRTARMRDWAGVWQQAINTLAAGAELDAALRAGRTGFEQKFGRPVFEYFAAEPELASRFAEFMAFMTARTADFVVAAHRFEPFGTVADIGGSSGALLFRVLEAYPDTRGVLFDLPGVIAQAAPAIEASAYADRIELVGGSFFEVVPTADLYLLKQVLHDWTDEECLRILGVIRRSIKSGGRLAVIDHLLAESPAPTEAQSTDLAMMIWATGRERKLADFARLFAASGFELARVSENPAGHSVIEAVPV
ncbi:MAG TPA: methyltransferase [Woeseiaceae bacterium]